MKVRSLLGTASNFPDIFWPGQYSSPEFLKKYPDWQDYIMISMEMESVNCHIAFDPLRLWETYPPVLNYLVNGFLQAMNNGSQEKAAKFVGVISHIIGDTGQAAHICNYNHIAPLFVKPDESYLLHTFMENNPEVSFPDHNYEPKSLGNFSEEVKWNLLQELARLKKRSYLTVSPIMNALLKDDSVTAASYASKTVGKCSDLLASGMKKTWHRQLGKSPP